MFVLIHQADNCVSENKNITLLAYVDSLIHHNVFSEIFLNYLPVGHTHQDIDASWKYMSTFFDTHNIHSWPSFVQGIKGYKITIKLIVKS
jgi:hypothetical protein